MGKPSFHPVGGVKLTQQHMEGVTDINKIMERHNRTGVFGSGRPNGRQPMFCDVSGDTFHEMLIKVQNIQGIFAGQPAKVRKRFGNNPENLLRFLENKENLAEAVELGLVDRDGLSKEDKAQLDLVDEAERKERIEFQQWRMSQRRNPFDDEEATSVPVKADEEAQPSFRKKKRTS